MEAYIVVYQLKREAGMGTSLMIINQLFSNIQEAREYAENMSESSTSFEFIKIAKFVE